MKRTIFLLLISFAASLSQAAPVSGQGTWETTLQARDLDGNMSTIEAYYDTVLKITWLADGNKAGMAMSWTAANNWATVLTVNGVTGWQLPTVADIGALGCQFAYTNTDCGYNVDTSSGETASMFFDTLGNKSIYDTSGFFQPGYGLSNTANFSNLQSAHYWSATEYEPDTSKAWHFGLYNGRQGKNTKTTEYYAWAVHSGDVGAAVIPIPAAVWLFGTGLIGLFCVARKRRS